MGKFESPDILKNKTIYTYLKYTWEFFFYTNNKHQNIFNYYKSLSKILVEFLVTNNY